MLDPTLHTPSYVRTHSATLVSAILAIGSTALATLPNTTSPQDVDEAMRLHAHAEKLQLVVFATGAKSIEIVQGLMVGTS